MSLPTSIISFESCPVQLAIFSNHDDFFRGRFIFPIKLRKGINYSGVTFIRRKGAGVFSSGNPNELEVAPGNSYSPGIEEMRADKSVTASLLKLAAVKLNHKPWICYIAYEEMSGFPVGKIEFDFHHRRRNGKTL